MQISNSPLVVVVGPTAAGKSDLAVDIALALDAEVVSADSVQVYRGFDIGTGKLTTAEMRGVPHHLMDVADPDTPFSAARFVELADQAVADITARGKQVVVGGGTGLYVRALTRGLFVAPPPSEEIRQRHRREAEELGAPALHQRLHGVDPEAASRIHPNDLLRISRALEVLELTGTTISELQRAHRFAQLRYPARLVGLTPTKEVLWPRIQQRVEAMMAAGWLDEVRRLIDLGHGESKPMGSLGYRQLRDHLRGELDLEEAVRQTVRDTRRFARRQLGWFRQEPVENWLEQRSQLDLEPIRRWVTEQRG